MATLSKRNPSERTRPGVGQSFQFDEMTVHFFRIEGSRGYSFRMDRSSRRNAPINNSRET